MLVAQLLFTIIVVIPVTMFAVDVSIKKNLLDKEFQLVYE